MRLVMRIALTPQQNYSMAQGRSLRRAPPRLLRLQKGHFGFSGQGNSVTRVWTDKGARSPNHRHITTTGPGG
jgi:hypothetical protein